MLIVTKSSLRLQITYANGQDINVLVIGIDNIVPSPIASIRSSRTGQSADQL
jgi:hypothetical protein